MSILDIVLPQRKSSRCTCGLFLIDCRFTLNLYPQIGHIQIGFRLLLPELLFWPDPLTGHSKSSPIMLFANLILANSTRTQTGIKKHVRPYFFTKNKCSCQSKFLSNNYTSISAALRTIGTPVKTALIGRRHPHDHLEKIAVHNNLHRASHQGDQTVGNRKAEPTALGGP